MPCVLMRLLNLPLPPSAQKRHCARVGASVRTMEDGDELTDLVTTGEVDSTGAFLVDDQATGRPRFDLVFLDIMMQRTNGEQVCKELRAAGIRTPIVAATGNGMQEDIERYLQAGFTRVMLKPFSSATVAALLRELVGTGTGTGEAEAEAK